MRYNLVVLHLRPALFPSHVAPIVSTTLLFLTKRIYSRREVFFLIGFREEFDVA